MHHHSADGISPARRPNSTVGISPLRVPITYSIVGISPTRRPNSVAGIFFLSKSQVHSSANGLQPHSKVYVNPTLLLGFFFHSEAKSLQVPLTGLPPLGNNTVNLPNRPHTKSNVPELKIGTPRRYDRVRTESMVKQTRQNLNK